MYEAEPRRRSPLAVRLSLPLGSSTRVSTSRLDALIDHSAPRASMPLLAGSRGAPTGASQAQVAAGAQAGYRTSGTSQQRRAYHQLATAVGEALAGHVLTLVLARFVGFTGRLGIGRIAQFDGLGFDQQTTAASARPALDGCGRRLGGTAPDQRGGADAGNIVGVAIALDSRAAQHQVGQGWNDRLAGSRGVEADGAEEVIESRAVRIRFPGRVRRGWCHLAAAGRAATRRRPARCKSPRLIAPLLCVPGACRLSQPLETASKAPEPTPVAVSHRPESKAASPLPRVSMRAPCSRVILPTSITSGPLRTLPSAQHDFAVAPAQQRDLAALLAIDHGRDRAQHHAAGTEAVEIGGVQAGAVESVGRAGAIGQDLCIAKYQQRAAIAILRRSEVDGARRRSTNCR
ncbi:hypothetical protein L1887_46959 [Cichorium endivia]|nr:hypothetical protein L1887_46959 [Cichorium endivia]